MDEIEALKRDKNVLMLELVRLRQQQQVRQHACGVWQVCSSGCCSPSQLLPAAHPLTATSAAAGSPGKHRRLTRACVP